MNPECFVSYVAIGILIIITIMLVILNFNLSDKLSELDLLKNMI